MAGGRPCKICGHPDRDAIDRELVAGESSFRNIASRFETSTSAVFRHAQEHLAERMARAEAERRRAEEARANADRARTEALARAEQRAGEDLTEQVRALRSKAMSVLLAAERSGDLRTALAGVREARACIELLMEAERLVDRRPQINVLVSPEWLTVRATLLSALTPYPDARVAVASALLALDASA